MATLKEEIQKRYQTHRTTRNAQQKAKMLDPSFDGFNIDPVLFKLINQTRYPGFNDPRHCFVFWARPPQPLRALIERIQERIRALVPRAYALNPIPLPFSFLGSGALELSATLRCLERNPAYCCLRYLAHAT